MTTVVNDFIREVNDFVDDFCDPITRSTHSKIYGVTNSNEKRLLHMIKYIKDNNIVIPAPRYERIANVIEAFLDYVDSNGGKYHVEYEALPSGFLRFDLTVPSERLRQCARDMRNMSLFAI